MSLSRAIVWYKGPAEAKRPHWLERLDDTARGETPRVHLGAIAAGEKVVASSRSSTYQFLRSAYGGKDQLNLILGFFARMESKASVLLAINTGMLAFVASNAPPLKEFSRCMDVTPRSGGRLEVSTTARRTPLAGSWVASTRTA